MKRSGFTLIELLVVISIIAILASILLPSLMQVKRQVGNVKCMSNIRQLGTAGLSYANDNKNYWPLFYDSFSGVIWYNHSLSGFLSEFVGKRISWVEGSYMCPPSLLCPAMTPATLQNGLAPATSYGMNQQGFDDAGINVWTSVNAYNLPRINAPSMKIAHIDSGTVNSEGKTSGYWNILRSMANLGSVSDCKVGYRHQNNTAACALFFDGHAGMEKYSELYLTTAKQPKDCWDVYDSK